MPSRLSLHNLEDRHTVVALHPLVISGAADRQQTRPFYHHLTVKESTEDGPVQQRDHQNRPSVIGGAEGWPWRAQNRNTPWGPLGRVQAPLPPPNTQTSTPTVQATTCRGVSTLRYRGHLVPSQFSSSHESAEFLCNAGILVICVSYCLSTFFCT